MPTASIARTRSRPILILLLPFVAACQRAPTAREALAPAGIVADAAPLTDPQRPRYHFLPARNWMNDPNGLIQVDGRYHLFYQHNPRGPLWGNMTWGHATSTDLVHWSHQPLALHPDRPYDRGGVFSGCIVMDGKIATAVYTGHVPEESQCVATSRDLITWIKDDANPVIPVPPREFGEVTGFRDPYVWRDGAGWSMAVGCGTRSGGGLVLLYSSPDLRAWTYVGPLYSGDRAHDMWECPSFFRVGDRWALLVSAAWSVYAMTGDYADHRFTPRHRAMLDDGGALYAPQVFVDERGRNVLFGWLRERRSDDALRAAGWAGVQSLPRVITLGADGGLRYRPAEEVETLRARVVSGPTGTIRGEVPVDLQDTPGDRCEVSVSFDPAEGSIFGLKIRQSPFAIEETVVAVDLAAGELSLDTGRSSIDPRGARERRTTALAVAPGAPVSLRVFIDASVVEIFADDRACLTGRIYPARPDSMGISVFSDGAMVRSFELWEMTPIWPPAL